ncbi:MAG: tetratricopeptide repeat protein [Limisphaerales bacterium]
MSGLARFCGILALAAGLCCAPGCRSPRTQAGPDATDLLLVPQEDRLAEAHARFASGILAELDNAPESALTNYLQSLQLDPGNERLALDVARRMFERSRPDEALGVLRASAGRPGASGDIQAWLGVTLAMAGRRDEAESALREAVRREPDSLFASRNLAQILAQSGRTDEALAVLATLGERPDLGPADLLGLAEAHGPLLALARPRAEEIRVRIAALARRALEAPILPPGDLLRAGDLLRIAGDVDSAVAAFERVLDKEPDLPGLRERLADIYLARDRREQAQKQLEALSLSQPTNPLPHYYLGLIALAQDRAAEAVRHFERALLLRPNSEPLHLDLAAALLDHGEPAKALEVLNRARQRFRRSFQLEYLTALAHLRTKDYAQAIRHFIAAEVTGSSDQPDPTGPVFHFQFGIAYERSQDFVNAAAQFEQAIGLNPDFAEALNYLGYMWAERGENLERARELIARAVRIEPDNPAFLDSEAWVLHQLGRSAEAVAPMRRAVELNPEPDATLFDHLGDILKALGRTEEARDAWRRSVEIEDNPVVRGKLEGGIPAGPGAPATLPTPDPAS